MSPASWRPTNSRRPIRSTRSSACGANSASDPDRARPRSEDEFGPFDRIDADPGVVRDLSQFAADEIRDRLPLTPGVDDLLKARGDVVVTHLPLLAGHDFPELPDAFHGDRRRVEGPDLP